MTPAAKYWVCKTAPNFVTEAMECLGGNGYVEENTLARLFREAPVNAIWEGSGNVMCLDVLRVTKHHSEEVGGALANLARKSADLPGASATAATIERMLRTGAEADARNTVELLARTRGRGFPQSERAGNHCCGIRPNAAFKRARVDVGDGRARR